MLALLTDREEQVLRLIADGLTNREIARTLSISEATVENHIHHIYLKLGVSNRAQAVVQALQGLLRPQSEAIAVTDAGNAS